MTAAMTAAMTTAVTATATTKAWLPRPTLSLRLRLLGWALALLAIASLASVFVIQQVLLNQLESRVAADMRQEVTEFRRLVVGRDPETGLPFGTDLLAIADTYLLRNEPASGEEMLIFVDGGFYRGSISPIGLNLPDELLRSWPAIRESTDGRLTGHPRGPVYWLATPIVIGDSVRGQFVVLDFTAARYADLERAVQVMALSCLLVIVVVAAGGYLAMGRALRPLRTATETARAISETDLSGRISASGSDEVAQMSRTFNLMLDRLQRAFITQQAFLSDAGHELRTPITIVRGHLELMGDDPAERRETITHVTDELERMNRMVNDLLMLARAEQPDFLHPDLVDASALMAEVFVKAAALGDRDWVLDITEPAWVFADRQRLTQAVMQLAQNAVQFTTSGQRISLAVVATESVAPGRGASPREEHTALSGAARHVRLQVTDQGIGVEPQDQERIFQRFARTERGRGEAEGSGLGLAIVAAIAHAHGGSIEVQSVPGVGSTFTLVLAGQEETDR